MTGILTTKNNKRYLFRTDSHNWLGVIAWEITEDIGQHTMCHKWKKFPRHAVAEIFSFENPPSTLSFLPALSLFL